MKKKYIKIGENKIKKKQAKNQKVIICHIIAVNNTTIFSFLIIWVCVFVSFFNFSFTYFHFASTNKEDTYYDSIFPNIHK